MLRLGVEACRLVGLDPDQLSLQAPFPKACRRQWPGKRRPVVVCVKFCKKRSGCGLEINEHRLRHMSPEVRGKQLKPVTFYLRENFYVTTAGAFRTQALIDTLLEIGADRLLFSVDYPYETVQEQTDWFDSLPISEEDHHKIGRTNAVQLLRLKFEETHAQPMHAHA